MVGQRNTCGVVRFLIKKLTTDWERRKKDAWRDSAGRARARCWNGACRSHHRWCLPVQAKGQPEAKPTRYAHART